VQQARAFGHANSLALAMSFDASPAAAKPPAQEIAEELIAYATEQPPFCSICDQPRLGARRTRPRRRGLEILLKASAASGDRRPLIGGRFCTPILARTFLVAGARR
jgi:hypothetical protein